MRRDISEPDWKIFRQLHSVALERFCEHVLSDVGRLVSESGKNAHERYLAVYSLLERRDKELGQAFNDLRRSTALLKLTIIRARGLVTDEEFARLSPETRDAVQLLQGM
jgi:hypothetical protein